MEAGTNTIVAALGGLLLGALLCWAWMRNAAAAARVALGAQMQGEQAAAQERIRGLEQERELLRAAHETLKLEATGWRDDLDLARDERAQLAERASRVPQLEHQAREAQEQRTALQAEVTRLAVQVTERTQKLEAAAERLRECEAAAEAVASEVRSLRSELQASREVRAGLEEKALRIAPLEAQLREAVADAQATAAAANQVRSELSEVRATLEAERSQSAQQLLLLQEARVELSNQFKALASEILEEKSKRFVETNQVAIGQIMDPLRERMTEFKSKIEEIHAKDIEQQATLKEELRQLKELNRQITEEAHGLAVALKGQSKKQGNWGELVLGNVLDRAGLCEGKDYRREVSFDTEEGRRRPDVVLALPQNKHLVIDAKVSLNAYTRYVNADDPVMREQALREHVGAIASRIAELADRRYYDLPGLNTPEMVFMFIPIESAFVEALRADESLFQRAIERNILVATPTTLLTSLNIVRQLWRFEEQNAHTAALADKAGKVYAKLVTFVGSMEKIGKQIGAAKESYDTAMGQLVAGRGNLINHAREFEKLGVSVKNQLPTHLVEQAALELDVGMPAPIQFIPSPAGDGAGEAPGLAL
ncbi:MAG: DNA recombination protein RmuC [Ramlibacter sp.]